MYRSKLEPLQPNDIGLILSYKCQSKCSHCIYNCSPDWREWATPEDVQFAMDQMLNWEHPFQVHLTGGEPFLNFPLLKQSVQFAKDRSIPVYIETNAGWCVSDELAERRFRELKQLGLGAILISVSPFHAQNIPLKYTINGLNAARQVFGYQNVMVYQSDWLALLSELGFDKVISLEKFIDKFGIEKTGGYLWPGFGLIGGGRAGKKLGYLTKRYPANRFTGESCHNELLYAPHSHFDLYGNFIPAFCGGISLGSWRDLSDLQTRNFAGQYLPLIEILVREGAYGLFEFAQREYTFEEDERGYVDKCHLCAAVRSHLVRYGEFAELLPVQFYERF